MAVNKPKSEKKVYISECCLLIRILNNYVLSGEDINNDNVWMHLSLKQLYIYT